MDRLPRGDETETKIRTEAAKPKKGSESVAVATTSFGWRGRVEPGSLSRSINIKGRYKTRTNGGVYDNAPGNMQTSKHRGAPEVLSLVFPL